MNNLFTKMRHFCVLLTAFVFTLSISTGLLTVLTEKKALAFHSSNNCLSSGTPGASNDLIIQTGESLTLSGEWFCDEVTVNGTLVVTPYNGTDSASGDTGTGRLVIRSNSTTVGATGIIDASGAGFGGNSVSLDGTNDYVDVGTGLNVSGAMTIDAWIKPATIGTQQAIVSKWCDGAGCAGGSTKHSYIFWIDTDGRLKFNVQNSSGVGAAVTSVAQLIAGNTYHVAATYNGSVIRVYINGRHEASVSATGTLENSAQTVRIGSHGSGGQFVNGLVDEVRISNNERYAACGGTLPCSAFTPSSTEFATDANTLGLWHFTEATGTTASDASGGDNGTLTGGASWGSQLNGVGLGGFGGAGGAGGAGSTTTPGNGVAGTNGGAGTTGGIGSGTGGGAGGTNGGSSSGGGGGGTGRLTGGDGGGGGAVNTTGNGGSNATRDTAFDTNANETLTMGASGGGGAGGAGGQGGGGGGGGGALGADGGTGGTGGHGGSGGGGGRGGGFIKLYSSGSLIISGSLLTKGLVGSSGLTGTAGGSGVAGLGVGAGGSGAGGATDSNGSGGANATSATGGGGGGGGAGSASGKTGGAGAGGGILLRSEISNGVSVSGTLDARSGGNLTGANAGIIKNVYACTTPSVGSNNGGVFNRTLDPTFSSISPTSGSTAGGQTVTINGSRMCADPTVSLGGALNPASGPSVSNTAPGSVLSAAMWAVGNTVRYVYTARVGGNETVASPAGSITAQPTVLDPTSALSIANAAQGTKEQGTAYAVGNTLQYEYAAENHLGKTNVSSPASHAVVDAVNNLDAISGGSGITDAGSGWANSTQYFMWVTAKVYPTENDFNNDTNGTETLAGSSTSFTTPAVNANDIKFDLTLPSWCSTPGSSGCLWNQGRIRAWFNTSNSFGTASLAEEVALGAGAVTPHCLDDADTGSSTENGFKMGTTCGDSGSWPSTFAGQIFSIHLRNNPGEAPSPVRPTANTTGARQVNITVPAPSAGLSSSPSTKNGLLYRKIGAGSFALLGTNTSYTGAYTVNDIGNAASGAPPTANTTGVQTISLSWSAISNATAYNIYRCIGTCASVTTDFDLIASVGSGVTSLVDTGIAADPNKGPPSTNQTLCQSPSVNAEGTTATCTTAAHPAELVPLTHINNQPSLAVNSFTQPNAYTYIRDGGSDTEPPTQPGTPSTASPANDNTPAWGWTASTDNAGGGISHYVFCWDTVSGGCANTANAPDNNFTHSTALADGTWYVKVKAVDTSGNQSDYSAVRQKVINAGTGGSGGGGAIEDANKSKPSAGPLEYFLVMDDDNKGDGADPAGPAGPTKPKKPPFDWATLGRWGGGLALLSLSLLVAIMWRRWHRPKLVLLAGKDGLRVVMVNLKASFLNNINFQIKPSVKLLHQWSGALISGSINSGWHKVKARAQVQVPKKSQIIPIPPPATHNSWPTIPSLPPAPNVPIRPNVSLPAAVSVNLIKHTQGFDYALNNTKQVKKEPAVVMNLRVNDLNQTSEGGVSFKVEVNMLKPKAHTGDEAIKWRVIDHRSWWRRTLELKPKHGESGWTISGEPKN